MALTFPNLLTSPKFLCKYLRIYPPATVIYYTHSQLAVQPCNAQKPCSSAFYKESKTEPKRTSRKNTEDVQGQLQSPCLQIEKVHLHKSQSYQAVNVLWQNIGTLDMHQKTMDESLLKKWNHDLLMDHKQLVLMVFEQDRIAGRPFFNHKQTLLHGNSTLQEEKTLPKAPAKEVKIKQTNSSYTHKSLIAAQQASKQHQQVCQISPSSFPLNDSISEAAMLFADLSNDTKMPSKKKVFKTGPDPTQLASVLLDLRDEIPEFFLKKPNYTIYHPKVKFVNNITETTTHGIYPYRAQVSGTRLVILSCMTELSVDVLKITKHPNEGAIKVRWRIKGIPMIRKLASHITRRVKASEDGYRYLDGFSVFEVGSDGLIHCHRLHKVMPSSSQEKDNALWTVFLLPLIHLLDPRSCETFGAFECRSTDKDIEPVSAESTDTLAHLL